MDQESIVRLAINSVLDERELAQQQGGVHQLFVWAVKVNIGDVSFSVDFDEIYILKMLHEMPRDVLAESMIVHICNQIDMSLDGELTYTERTRTVH